MPRSTLYAILLAAFLVGCSGSDDDSTDFAPPTLEFTASPTTVGPGETSVLSWQSQNVLSCDALGLGWDGRRPPSGSELIGPLSETTEYRLRCTGLGGRETLTATVTVEINTLSGQLFISSISQTDGDVNDPNAPYRPNDSAATAQSLPNPVVVGGYVNEPGRGPEGRSFAGGDLDDIYRVSLAEGQLIELVVPSADPDLPDSERDDADLGLYDEAGNLIDESVGIGQVEQLIVPSSGTYFVRVANWSGAPLYRLSIGQSSIPSVAASLKLSDEFVPREVVVTLSNRSAAPDGRQKVTQSLESGYALRMKAGDSSREMLMQTPPDAASYTQYFKPSLRQARAQGLRIPSELEAKSDTLRYIKLLRSDPAVATADLNRIERAMAVPNDPLYAIQRWHYELIQLPSAWNITTGSSDVIVAVIDTGVFRHPDLLANLSGGYDFISDPSNPDGDGRDSNPDDPGCIIGGGSTFHGTHVAGTVAAASNNSAGVAGVAWGARIMPIRVLDGCAGTGTYFDINQGIRYAAGLVNESGTLPPRKADVINLSLGSQTACDATRNALFAEVRAQGVVVVAAAGNKNTSSPTNPASCPNVVSVSSVGSNALRAPYSNYGASWVDVAAPGGDMTVDRNGDGRPDGVYSTHAAGGGSSRLATFDFLQGTSMAAPHMAGVIALMKSVKPTLTPDEVDSLLAQGLLTSDIGPAGPDELGVGLINAFKSVQAVAGTLPPVPPTLALTPSSLNFGDIGTRTDVALSNGGSGDLTVTGTATSASWATVSPTEVDVAGLGRYAITVERAGLAPGTYSSWVDFASSAGTKRLSILMQVADGTAEPTAGLQYVLLLGPADGDALDQLDVLADAPSVPYRFDFAPSGEYLVAAGTDMNNDFFICDDGEACGVYPVESDPVLVPVSGETSGIDFATAFRTSLQAQSAATAGGDAAAPPRRGFSRRDR